MRDEVCDDARVVAGGVAPRHAAARCNAWAMDLASVSAVASLGIALVSLLIACVALRFGIEQARAYLFPVPMLLLDDETGAVILRNLGGGPMVDVWLDLQLFEPGLPPTSLQRHVPSVIAGEQRVVIEADLVKPMALAEVKGDIRFENLRGAVRRQRSVITASQLAA